MIARLTGEFRPLGTHLFRHQTDASACRFRVPGASALRWMAPRDKLQRVLTSFIWQTLRFYHMLLGAIAFILSFIHTFAYIAHVS